MNKEIQYMAKWGMSYYNRLREFYDNPERLALLEYVILYASTETIYCGKTIDDKSFLKEKMTIRAYKTFSTLYKSCIHRLYKNRIMIPIKIPSKEKILTEIQRKYKRLEERLNDSKV